MAKEIICVREFKQYLLAMNCRCRGASTLLTNLLHQRRPMDRYHESWQAQYGLPFKEAAWIVYVECQVILFGIKARLPNCEHREILLNPENNYEINEDDLCVYMCESPREVDDVNAMDYKYVRTKVEAMKARRRKCDEGMKGSYRKPSEPPHPTASRSSSLRNELLNSLRNNSKLQKLQQQQQQHVPNPPISEPPSPTQTASAGLRHSASSESNKSLNQNYQHHSSAPPRQKFKLSRLPTPRLALLTGSRKLISRLGQMSALEQSEQEIDTSPVCYLLDKPAIREELILESTEFMSGHILVCMHHRVSNIFKFIYNLSRFPKVYFMEGDCQHPEDLIKAGVMRAKQVVVMSERECLDRYERSSDSPAVMTSHLLDLLLKDKPHDASRIVNLVEKSNIRFMHLLQGKDVAEEVDLFYTPAYAAGNVVVDGLLSNVLLSQTYYKPDIVSIIKALCGMPGPLYDKDTAHILICGTHIRPKKFRNSRHMMLIVMPPSMIDKCYSFLFENMLMDHDVLPLGILRAPDEHMGNELSFVYTNPVSSLIMRRSDKIYVLASPGWNYYASS
ncbi:hypothetical protein BDF21DRAFT_334855 [Thamnidium elegans]|nr:hypothetical protein BDF21DRAFT_334855 [Thamnidium elegans]